MSSPARDTYVARESAISGGINAMFSAGFFFAVFWGHDPVPVWGMGNYAFDFVPQSFAIGLMASLVPGLLALRAAGSGRVEAAMADGSGASVLFLRSLLNAALATLLGAGLCVAVLWITGAESIGLGAAFIFKVIYGAALGAAITRWTIGRLLV